MDGDRLVHVAGVVCCFRRRVVAYVTLAGRVTVVGWWGRGWHEGRVVRERRTGFLTRCCVGVVALVAVVRRAGVVFCVLAAHAHGGTHWGELGDDDSVVWVADGCVPRAVDVVADDDHEVGGGFGCERGR